MSWSENLRIIREQKGYTIQKVADQLNISRCTVANYEAGRREPQAKILQKIADFYEVSIKEIFTNEKEPEDTIESLLLHTTIMLRSEKISKEKKDQTMKKIMDLWINDQRERAIAL